MLNFYKVTLGKPLYCLVYYVQSFSPPQDIVTFCKNRGWKTITVELPANLIPILEIPEAYREVPTEQNR